MTVLVNLPFSLRRYFESLGVHILSVCYNKDKQLAHQLLVRELHLWGDSTLFQRADSGQLMDFMEHPCCQTKLNSVWKGKMPLYTPTWQVGSNHIQLVNLSYPTIIYMGLVCEIYFIHPCIFVTCLNTYIMFLYVTDCTIIGDLLQHLYFQQEHYVSA